MGAWVGGWGPPRTTTCAHTHAAVLCQRTRCTCCVCCARAQVELLRRGFYPKGGGHVRVRARSLPAGQALPAFDLTARGHLTSVHIRAHGAGAVGPAALQRMLETAVARVQRMLGALGGQDLAACAVTTEVEHTSHEEHAAGTGGGIIITARTSTGCVLGASPLTNAHTSARCSGLCGCGVGEGCVGGPRRGSAVVVHPRGGRGWVERQWWAHTRAPLRARCAAAKRDA